MNPARPPKAAFRGCDVPSDGFSRAAGFLFVQYFHEARDLRTWSTVYKIRPHLCSLRYTVNNNALGALYVAPGALQATTKQSCSRYFTNDGTYAYVHRGEAPKSLAAASGSAHPLLLLLVLKRCCRWRAATLLATCFEVRVVTPCCALLCAARSDLE